MEDSSRFLGGPMNPEWFAGRLKELREQAGLTQQELADKAGLKLGGIRNLEQGRTYPEWPSVLSLCAALGVECGAFCTPPATEDRPGPGRPQKERPEAADAKEKRPRGRPRKETEKPKTKRSKRA